jgi:hypothetical protein
LSWTKEAFDKEGIEIPWPHTKVFFGNAPFKISVNALVEKESLTQPGAEPRGKRKKRQKLPPVATSQQED